MCWALAADRVDNIGWIAPIAERNQYFTNSRPPAAKTQSTPRLRIKKQETRSVNTDELRSSRVAGSRR